MENTYDFCCGSNEMCTEPEGCEKLVCEAGTCGLFFYQVTIVWTSTKYRNIVYRGCCLQEEAAKIHRRMGREMDQRED